MVSVVSARWGRGAVGSAPRWHRGGRGFESHRFHHLKKPKNLPEKTANCYHPLLPHVLFFLAFQHESFALCEENSLWRTTRSSHASTPVMENFRTSTRSSRRIIVRFRSKEPLTTYVLAAGQAHANQNRKRCQCGDRSLTEHGKLQSTKHYCRVPCGSHCCRARPCTTQDSS